MGKFVHEPWTTKKRKARPANYDSSYKSRWWHLSEVHQLSSGEWAVTACGKTGRRWETTLNVEKVTCPRCQEIIKERQGK